MKRNVNGRTDEWDMVYNITYRLNLPTSWRIHNVFHAILLKPYQENETYGEIFSLPPPEIIDGEEVYQVETILRH